MKILGGPDRQTALKNYRLLASGYDASCRRIEEARHLAITLLDVRPGHVLYDVACGTGATLPLLAAAAGSAGLVFGVENRPKWRRSHGAFASVLATSRSPSGKGGRMPRSFGGC